MPFNVIFKLKSSTDISIGITMQLLKLSVSLIMLHISPVDVPGLLLELLCVASEPCRFAKQFALNSFAVSL